MKLPANVMIALGAHVVGAVVGLGLGWKIASPKAPKWPFTTAPSIRLRDGALIAERRIDPEAKSKQELPHGVKPVRILSAVVTPQTNGSNPGAPVTVDVTLTDDSRAVISSPNGTVTTATDVWVAPPPRSLETKHTLITGYNPITRDALLGYTRRIGSIGPVTFEIGGMAVYQDQKPSGYALFVARW